MDASSRRLGVGANRVRGHSALDCECWSKAVKSGGDGSGTSTGTGKKDDCREAQTPLPARSAEGAHGNAFQTASPVPEDFPKEHTSDCSGCSSAGQKVVHSSSMSTHRAATKDSRVPLDASLSHAAGDELVEFIATELEQQHARIAALSTSLTRLERAVAVSDCDVAALAREQREKSGQQVMFMRRLETEVARGAELRSEEAQLRNAKLEKSLRTIRRDVEGTLASFKRAQESRLREMEEKVGKMVVDVVVENQTLKAENMELRVALQQVVAAANSNKKTLRVLTDEILKLKRQLGRSPSTDGPDSASDRLERGIALALHVASSDSAHER